MVSAMATLDMCSYQRFLKTGIYRTESPISNLKFRFIIQEINSLIDIPVLEGISKPTSKGDPRRCLKETRNLCWQEKVFSRYEIDYYGVKENCKSERQRLYYNRLKSKSHGSDILFTYVDGDNFFPEDLDNQNPRHPLRQKLKRLNVNAESMYLMADLGQDVLIFCIHWYPQINVLFVYPDFNRMSLNPYYYEARGSNLQIYHYALEKWSTTKFCIPGHLNTLAFTDESSRSINSSNNLRKQHFYVPQPLHRDSLILLEIIGATAFEYDGIQIRYHIKLPNGVKTTQGNNILSSSTHSSRNYNGLLQFGHCHELFLTMDECEKKCNPSINIFFEAISIDSWRREIYLGQSHLSIQLHPQKSHSVLNFVQLTHHDVLFDSLEAFLIGNHRKVDLVSFYEKNDRNILNRYGNETKASGKVNVRYQVICQHEPKVFNDRFYKKSKKTKNVTLKELVATYNAARERLEEFIDLTY